MRASVRASTISNLNIPKTTRPIVIKFYLKHHCGGGKVVLGFGPGRVRILVSMSTDSSHRLTMGKKNKKKSSSPKPQGPELSYFVCSNV